MDEVVGSIPIASTFRSEGRSGSTLGRQRCYKWRMRTPLCDELGIEFPIFAFTHCRDVVVAVSRAGGFGVLGAVGFTPEQLEVELKWIDENIGDHPYGVDIVIPNKYEGMDSHLSAEDLAESL